MTDLAIGIPLLIYVLARLYGSAIVQFDVTAMVLLSLDMEHLIFDYSPQGTQGTQVLKQIVSYLLIILLISQSSGSGVFWGEKVKVVTQLLFSSNTLVPS